MAESVFEELKRYVHFGSDDEAALRSLHPLAAPEFVKISEKFYARILEHEEARKVLEGGESQVGHLKVTLVHWMELLLTGPWDDAYFERRCRIGRMHVRIALPQHYMFGAMNILRQELNAIIDRNYLENEPGLEAARLALGKALDLELAIMLHTYREDLAAQQARGERLATFGQLVGSIGHELRNPLGVIETSLFILRSRMAQDERAIKHADRIEEQVTIANRIITDLLDLIRERPMTPVPTSLGPILRNIVETMLHAAEVKFTLEGIDVLPNVLGDAGQLRQVFLNLIENALHAASPAGEVTISGKAEERTVEVWVQDSGPGIDPNIRKRLFEPLITTKTKGVGLGLALVKRIVERHRGTIVCDQKPGVGACFVVMLPRELTVSHA